MIVKSALILIRCSNDQQEILMVREGAKPYWIFPGGKQEPGETVEQALQREIREELGTAVVDVQDIGSVDGFTPDGRSLSMHLFTGTVETEPAPSAEITELRWMSANDAQAVPDEFTPITIQKVFPYLASRGIW